MQGSMLKFIEMVREANSEEDVTTLMDIMNPTDDESEMGEKYKEVLGYNPITYFDEIKVEKALIDLSEKYPSIDIASDDEAEECLSLISNYKEQTVVRFVYDTVRLALESDSEDPSCPDDETKAEIKKSIAKSLNIDEERVDNIIRNYQYPDDPKYSYSGDDEDYEVSDDSDEYDDEDYDSDLEDDDEEE